MRMKGISPLIATVLLIAFVIAVGGIVSTWTSIFVVEQTEIVGAESKAQITCSYGSISIKDVKFSGSDRLTGVMRNNGNIPLSNIIMSVVYQNSTSQSIKLCKSGSSISSCPSSNSPYMLSLAVSQQDAFNISIGGSNYRSVRISTNCPSVSDSLERGDIA